MAGVTGILALLCAAGCHLSRASPAPGPAHVVQVGQNVTLTCNLTSSAEVTWYLLRSDQLTPLLTVARSRLGGLVVDPHPHADDARRFGVGVGVGGGGDAQSGPVALRILRVERGDAGRYFCTGRCAGRVCVHGATRLDVHGAESPGNKVLLPCWSLGICVLPASLALVLVLVLVFGVYLCSGKPAVCCCDPERAGSRLKVAEDVSLHYSSVKPAGRPRPRPPGRVPAGQVKEDVVYSTVAVRKTPDGSHDRR